jgi:hypothetical protein
MDNIAWKLLHLLSLLLLLFFCSFCQPISRITHGTKKPKVISNEELIARAKESGLYLKGNMYSISYEGWVTFAEDNTDFPTFHLYKGNVKYIYNEPLGCNHPVTDLLSSISDKSLVHTVPTDSSNFYGYYIENVETSEKPRFSKDRYSLLIFWVSYIGRYNEPILGYLDEIKDRDDIDFYLVSGDPREDW